MYNSVSIGSINSAGSYFLPLLNELVKFISNPNTKLVSMLDAEREKAQYWHVNLWLELMAPTVKIAAKLHDELKKKKKKEKDRITEPDAS